MTTSSVAMPSLFLNSTQKGRGERTISLNLTRGLFFPEVERIYCQVTQAVIPYSMINISKELYNNACFTITPVAPGLPIEIMLDEGVYPSITELEQAMNKKIDEALGPNAFFDIKDRATYYWRLDANTSTNKITGVIPINLPTPPGLPSPPSDPNPLFNLNPQCLDGSSNLFQELGFNPDQFFSQGATIPLLNAQTSLEPITFLDILASGIYIVCEDDLQVLSYLDDQSNANILAQVPFSHEDRVGGQILYPRDLEVVQCPLVEGKSVKQFKIRLISPRDPTRDIIFLQGDFSCVLTFNAVY